MEVIIDGKSRRKLYQGACFGSLALLYNEPRSATIKALKYCEVWGLNR